MQFSAAFELLPKFTAGLPKTPTDEQEVLAVARYLGVALPGVGLEQRAALVCQELSAQNAFLSYELASDSIYTTAEYIRSAFIREIVANNRANLDRRGRGSLA